MLVDCMICQTVWYVVMITEPLEHKECIVPLYILGASSVPCRGGDFHRAMMATAPGEKLLIGRRPMRNLTQLHRFV